MTPRKGIILAGGSGSRLHPAIRKGSPTFGEWEGMDLTEDNFKQRWIPAGFAHGFLVTSDSAEFLYKTTDYYDPEHERCIAWNDPDLAIDWPLNISPQLSIKDSNAPLLRCCELRA